MNPWKISTRLIRIVVVGLLCLGCVAQPHAQPVNLGVPFVRNFSKQVYGAGTQSWDFGQTPQNVLLVANNEGLLLFDGTEWQKLPLPNRTIVRSLAAAPDGRVYVGGQDEVGYFAAAPGGSGIAYHSLKDRLPELERSFADVWSLVELDSQLFFRASDKIYHLGSDSLARVIHADQPFLFLGRAGRRIYVQQAGKGLFYWNAGSLSPLPGTESFDAGTVTDLLDTPDGQLLLATEKAGLFVYRNGAIEPLPIDRQAYLRDNRIMDVALLSGNRLAVATELGGLLLLDLEKRRTLQWLHRGNGLQSNIVRAVYADQQGDLWLGLDNGIDHVQTSSPFSRVAPTDELETAAYAVQVAEGRLFIGNANGLWTLPWAPYFDPFNTQQQLRHIEGTAGQVWGLNYLNGRLWIGHHEGAFVLEADQPRRLSPGIGYWTFLPYSTGAGEDAVISGTYYNLAAFRPTGNGTYRFQNELEGLEESSRILVTDKAGNIWMSHPYRGIYRLRPNDSLTRLAVRFYGAEQGLPDMLENYVSRIGEEIIVCAARGIFRYDAATDRFVPHPRLTEIFGADVEMRRLLQDDRGNIWYITTAEAGLLQVDDRGLTKEIRRRRFPHLRPLLVGGFEHIYPYDDHNVFFGAERGVIHYDPARDTLQPAPPTTIISRVFLIAGGDSLVYDGRLPATGAAGHNYRPSEQAFRFQFSALAFDALHRADFQYMLDGLDEDWSDWTALRVREYTNLPPGEYTFRVRARVNGLTTGPESSFDFRILPPWYRTPLAFTLYGLGGGALLLALVLVPRRRFEREKTELQVQHFRQTEAHQKTIEQLRTEKLESEVAHKNRELASMTMHLVQKNELLGRMSEKIETIEKAAENTTVRRQLRQLRELLREDKQLDDDWDQFANHFDQVHSGFFRRLREQYPDLTPKDHRLCAYLRMNLTTKEIAPLMNISIRGVEISRYRLRRKMGLDTEVNLNDFMMNF